MAIFRFRSVRAKLIATTMSVFAVLLTVLVFVADFGSRRAVFNSIDQDLKRRGEDLARVIAHDGGHHPGPMDGGQGPPGGMPPHGFGGDAVFAIVGGPGDRDLGPNGPGPGGPPDSARADPEWIAPKVIPLKNDRIAGYDPVKQAYDPGGFAQAVRGGTFLRTIRVAGDLRRILSVPAKSHDHVTAVVQISYEMQPALDALSNFRATLLRIVVPLGVLFGGLASFFVVDRLLKPLRHVTSEAGRIGREGFGERLVPLGDDEFASLAATLNGMLGRLENVYRVEQETNRRLAQTIEQQQRFTSDASHELKTPLSVVKAYAGLLKRSRATVAEESESIAAIDQAADRMNALIRNLLVLARGDAGNNAPRKPCDLRQIVDAAILLVPAAKNRVCVHQEAGTHQILGSEDELVRVFVNLIENAIKHSGAERIEVDLKGADEWVEVIVSDRGAGIAPEHLPHLFDRFYRPDQSRSVDTGGSGLGLAICEQIVKAHGGTISVESTLGEGSRFTVRLPAPRNVSNG